MHGDGALREIHGLNPDVLILISQLEGMGIELTVRSDDAVAVEVVVRGVGLVIVAAIGVERCHAACARLILGTDGIVVGHGA